MRLIGDMSLSGPDSHLSFKFDTVSLWKENYDSRILALGVIGPLMSCRALMATMQTPGIRARLDFLLPEANIFDRGCKQEACGYDVYRVNLAYGQWNYLFVSKRDGLVRNLNDEALWQELKKPDYTTPVLRKWIPYLKGQLEACGMVKYPRRQSGCKIAIVKRSPERLDEVVSNGLKTGAIEI